MGTLESQLNGAGRRSLCLTSITFSLRWGEVIVAQQQPGLSGGSGASALARIDPLWGALHNGSYTQSRVMRSRPCVVPQGAGMARSPTAHNQGARRDAMRASG